MMAASRTCSFPSTIGPKEWILTAGALGASHTSRCLIPGNKCQFAYTGAIGNAQIFSDNWVTSEKSHTPLPTDTGYTATTSPAPGEHIVIIIAIID